MDPTGDILRGSMPLPAPIRRGGSLPRAMDPKVLRAARMYQRSGSGQGTGGGAGFDDVKGQS